MTTDPAEQRAYEMLTDFTMREAYDEAAVQSLAKLGEPAIPALVEALDLSESKINRLAARALALIPSRRVIASLLNFAERTTEGDIAAIALRGAAARLGPDDRDRVSGYLRKMTRHDDEFVRAAAIDALVIVEDRDATNLLLKLSGDEDEFVAERARAAMAALANDDDGDGASPAERLALLAELSAFESRRRRNAVAKLVGHADAAVIIRSQLDSSDDRLRSSVLQAAADRPRSELFDDLTRIIENYKMSDHDRALALRGLAPPDSYDEVYVARMLERFSKSDDPFVRAASGEVAVRFGTPQTLKTAYRLLTGADSLVRDSVARAWSEYGSRSRATLIPAVEAVLDQITSAPRASDELNRRAIWLLEGLHRAVADGAFFESRLVALVGRLVQARPPKVRECANRTYDLLRDHGSPDAVEHRSIEPLLESPDPSDVDRGLSSLEGMSRGVLETHVRSLIQFLYRGSDEQLIRAARLLRRIETPSAAEALERLRKHPSETVQRAATPERVTEDRAEEAGNARSSPDDREDPARRGDGGSPTNPLPSTNRWGKPWK